MSSLFKMSSRSGPFWIWNKQVCAASIITYIHLRILYKKKTYHGIYSRTISWRLFTDNIMVSIHGQYHGIYSRTISRYLFTDNIKVSIYGQYHGIYLRIISQYLFTDNITVSIHGQYHGIYSRTISRYLFTDNITVRSSGYMGWYSCPFFISEKSR